MAHIPIPNLTAEDIMDILWGTAQRENTVFIRVQPDRGLASFLNCGDSGNKEAAGDGNSIVALDLHLLNLLDQLQNLIELSGLKRRQGDDAATAFIDIVIVALFAKVIEQRFVFRDQAYEVFFVLVPVCLGRAECFHRIDIARNILFADSLAKGILGRFLKLVGFIHYHEAAFPKQRRMVIRLGFLGHEVHIVVRDLEIQIRQVIHLLCKIMILALFLLAASGAGTFDADPVLDCSADAITVQINSKPEVCHLLEEFDVGCVFLWILLDVSEIILKAVPAEVMLLSFPEYRSQRLFNDVIVQKYTGEIGNLTLYQGFLQFNAGGSDGDRQLLTVDSTVMMLGNNRCHQIGKSLSGSDFRLAERDLFLGKADVHLLCKADLFLPNEIAVVGEHNSENGVNDLKGVIRKSV